MHEIEIPDDLSAERPPLLPAAPAGWPRPEAVAPSFYFIDDRRAGGRAHGGRQAQPRRLVSGSTSSPSAGTSRCCASG